ncbi:MAG: hypothetical protein LH472_08945 [Pyrinomonadaceae bacterium]|nr:hypothetical protein [Pyrinomonadaceae bacterium]
MKDKQNNKKSERGGAGVKMVAVLAVLFLVGHAGFNYVPTAYQGQGFKQDMQTAILQGMAVPPGVQPVDMVKGRLLKAIAANGLPPNVVYEVKPGKEGVTAHVAYSKAVPILPFGIYTYNYQFDHTATPTGFLLK